MIKVEIANATDTHTDVAHLRDAVQRVLGAEGVSNASISLAIVDDPTIHRLNRDYLHHDYPTDVLTFPTECRDDFVEGEIIISADTARRTAPEYGTTLQGEILLYLIHGLLHLVGYDDRDDKDQTEMRQREIHHLATWKIHPRHDVPRNHLDTASDAPHDEGEFQL